MSSQIKVYIFVDIICVDDNLILWSLPSTMPSGLPGSSHGGNSTSAVGMAASGTKMRITQRFFLFRFGQDNCFKFVECKRFVTTVCNGSFKK